LLKFKGNLNQLVFSNFSSLRRIISVNYKLKMLDNIREEKIRKLNNFIEAGIDPYPSGPFEKQDSQEVLKKPINEEVKLAGRLMLFRDMGNITFIHIQDESGRIQVVLNKKEFSGDYKLWVKNIDIGDFVGIEGKRFDTQKGEKSVLAENLILLSKSILPLPDKHKALQDEEQKLRKRYLDILFNPEIKEMIYKRDIFWSSIRKFLKKKDFTEVETPVLEVTAGGADAEPFATHHNALDLDVYLRISMGELWQKRLMIAGMEKTFEIGRQFRNEGMDAEHLQDYTQMEFYWAYANYEKGMKLVEELFKYIAQETFGTLNFKIRDFDIDLSKEWETYDYTEIIKEMTGVDVYRVNLKTITEKIEGLGIKYNKEGFNINRAIDTLWKHCRKQIPGPGFLINEPVLLSPLAKKKKDRPELAERFHVIIAGSELGNGYSELNDPIDQAERFKIQQKLRDEGDEEAQMNDEDFVEALEYGMPPVCGFGMSERVFSFLMDKTGRECQIFPLMKKK
jgi:lysyl-tRNA synthetase class 2